MRNEETSYTNERLNKLRLNVENHYCDDNLVANAQLELLVNLYQDISNIVVPNVIEQLKNLNKDSLLSGDNSGLENVWEEICVQVQYEPSYYYEMYVITMDGIIKDELKKLPLSFQQLVSYLGVFNEEPDSIAYSERKAIEGIREDLLSIAVEYNIENCLINN